jgi:hypothetical protein
MDEKRLTKQHMSILSELSIRDGLTIKQIGIRDRRAMLTLNGHGLVWNNGRDGERWHITEKGYEVVRRSLGQ